MLDEIDAGFEALAQGELAPGDAAEANELIRRTEQVGRKADAVRVRALTAVDDGAWYLADGHRSAQVLTGHVAHISDREARRRARAMRALRDLPAVKAGFEAGVIGSCQVDRIARVHANPRVVGRFLKLDEQIAVLATRLSYDEFDRRLTRWVRSTDEDGTADRSRRCHENRRARLTQDYDGGWELLAGFGSIDGAKNHAILRAYTDAEFAKDWAEATAIHGDRTTVDHLARTHDQRCADALTRALADAADHWAASEGGARIDLNIVINLSEIGTLYTGSARLAAQLDRCTCYWPACTIPTGQCQIDHLQPRRTGGRTSPGNGAPCCGRHNRLKEQGYTVRRDERGRIRIHRPDGTPLEDWC